MEGVKGLLYVLVGPSASGKTTLFRGVTEGFYILQSGENIELPECCRDIPGTIKKVITATTRKPRPREVDGVHYKFLSREQFEAHKEGGSIIEETLYAGESYGILAPEISRIFEGNQSGIIILDEHGVKELKRIYGNDRIISIFIYRELEKIGEELNKRTENEEEINSRIKIAVKELESKDNFDYIIYNTKTLEEGLGSLCRIIKESRVKVES